MLTIKLLSRNIPFVVLDRPNAAAASAVAAGMMNPFVFKYLTFSWDAPQSFVPSMDFYRQSELLLNASFFHPTAILKLFDKNEAQLWAAKILQPGYAKLLKINPPEIRLPESVFAPYGFGLVQQAAWLNVPFFMQKVRETLTAQHRLVEAFVDYHHFKFNSKGVIYNDIEAKTVVFCEGWLAKDNPWFGFVPFRPVKGELLTLKIAGFALDRILTKDAFLLPQGHGLFKLGSTYDWSQTDEIPSLQAKNDLLGKLEQMLKTPVEVVAHEAGVRPAIANRKPIVGGHPSLPGLYILNGLGAKGVQWAPAIADQLIAYLEGEKEPDAVINVKRFAHLQH